MASSAAAVKAGAAPAAHALLNPRCSMRKRVASSSDRLHRLSHIVVMSSMSSRLHLANVQYHAWVHSHDHLIACEERQYFPLNHPLTWLCGMNYGSPLAHRALAAVLCAHRTPQRQAYDWMLVVDDDTVVNVATIDALLRGAAPRAVPSMLGSRVDMQLNGSVDEACGPSVPHSGGSKQDRHALFVSSSRSPCSAHSYANSSAWAFSAQPHAGGWVQRGAWAVGWPYGGHGILVSQAAAVALERVGEDCLACLTCPIYGTYTSHHHSLASSDDDRSATMASSANKSDGGGNHDLSAALVQAEAALGFGKCGGISYDEHTHKCASAYNGRHEWDERRRRHRFVPDQNCVGLGMRCAETDVQLGLCFGRAGYAPQALPRGRWSTHLNAIRGNLKAFEAAVDAFVAL